MGKARMHVSDSALISALHLPENTQIVAVLEDDLLHPLSVTFIVDHPDIPTTDEGTLLPVVSPTFRRHAVEFLDWGLKP